MGWRAWDAYDQEAKARWHALPWRERYSWRRIAVFLLIVVLAVAVLWANIAHAQASKFTDAQIVDKIIEASRNDYYACATGAHAVAEVLTADPAALNQYAIQKRSIRAYTERGRGG